MEMLRSRREREVFRKKGQGRKGGKKGGTKQASKGGREEIVEIRKRGWSPGRKIMNRRIQGRN